MSFKGYGLRRREAIFYLFLALEQSHNTYNENEGEVPFSLEKVCSAYRELSTYTFLLQVYIQLT